MVNTYSTAKICPFQKQNCDLEKEGLSLEPGEQNDAKISAKNAILIFYILGIENIMATSTNYSELTYAWTKWRDMSGAKIKKYYGRYVELSNEVAKANSKNILVSV